MEILNKSHVITPLNLLPINDDSGIIIEMEKERLGRDLHDHVGQILASIKLNIEAIKLHATNPDVVRIAKLAEENIQKGNLAVSNAIQNLKPQQVEADVSLSMKSMFLGRLKDAQIKVVFGEMEVMIVLSAIKYEQLCYIVQEAITNIIKHSRANEVRVTLYQKNLRLRLVIEDNGVGITEDNNKPKLASNGFKGIKHRVALLNGAVEFAKSSFSNDLPGLKLSFSFPY